jgi:hypothetical protein
MLVENEMEAIAKGDDIAERNVLVPAEREDAPAGCVELARRPWPVAPAEPGADRAASFA